MTTKQWHVDEGQLAAYAGGTLWGTQACSVEAHVMGCAACQARLAPRVAPARLDAVWAEVIDTTDQPAIGLAERFLRRSGVSLGDARLLAATLSTRVSWFVAVAITVCMAVLAGQSVAEGELLFLLVAPVLPLGGVALAYGEGFDPLWSVAQSAPMPAWRLLFLRSAAVLGPTVAMLGPASFLIGPFRLSSAAWLAPSLALVVSCLALTTYISVGYAAVALSGVWLLGVLLAQDRQRVGVEGFGHITQLVAMAMAVAAGVVLLRREKHLDLRGGYQ